MRSAKNLKAGSLCRYIPVLKSHDERICPVRWLSNLLVSKPYSSESKLFDTKDCMALTYCVFARQLKILVKRAKLVGDYSSHSLRRGGATFLSSSGCSVVEVKDRGGWKSDCLFKYICPPLSQKVNIDRKFVS